MEDVFLKILNMNLSAAAVICVVLLVRLALRRAPKKWSYLLWAVVAFRLVCPVSFSAPFSVMRYAVQPAAVTQRAERSVSEITYIPQNIGEMAEPKVYVSSSPAVSEYVSQSLPRPLPWNSANPLQIYIPICAGLWCLGMAALLLYGIISYVNLRRRLRGAVRAENGVFETDSVRAPFILGLFSPTIYLPPGLEGEPLRYVLAHERFHIRHADHAVKLFGFLLLCVHWFNPLVWLAFALMSRDMEMRCDEAVLSAESGITKPYSMALLSFASARRFPSPSPLCFGETGVKERIKNVLRWKKPKVWVTVCAALLCVAAIAACAVNPGRKEDTGAPTGMPWNWTSTVRVSDIKSAEWNGVTLAADQRAELVRLLNDVEIREVVRGRGIPSINVLDITTGVGYRLRWAGGIIELDFDDVNKATELYGPGVWEIHNDALYEFLDSLEDPTPASASDLLPADGFYSAEELIEQALNSDGAESEAVQYQLYQRLRMSPMETLEAVGARSEGIRDWLCWTLSEVVKLALQDGDIADAAEIVADTSLAENGAAAWSRFLDYVNHTKPAPKSWRQVYLDFYNNLRADTVYGVSLMDLDFDAVPELMVWDGAASGAAFGTLYQNDGTKVVRVSQRLYSTNIVTGHLNEQPWPPEDLSAFLLVRQRQSGNYYWSVHDGNGQNDRAWGSYLIFDGAMTEIAAYDSAKKEDRTAAWETFNSQYEVLDVDYSGFTLSIYTDGDINSAAFNALLNRWRPVRIYTSPQQRAAYTAVSGGVQVALTPLTAAGASVQLNWLPIVYDDYGQPFEIVRAGETEICGYTIQDAETLAKLEYFHPSGLSPQTYLFENAMPGRRYIITVDTFGENGRYAFGAEYSGPIYDLSPEKAWKLRVSSGGETVTAYEMMRYEMTWTESGWLAADGIPVEAALEHADAIPTLTLDWDFLVSYGTGITNRTYPTVCDLDFKRVQECSPAGVSQLFFLKPGEYYVVFGVYGPVGRYIESEGRYEESGWDCIVRLRVDRHFAEAWTPGALSLGGLTGLKSAVLGNATLGGGRLIDASMGSVTLSDEASRQKIIDCLNAAEAYGPTKCPFGTTLWLTRADGMVFALCPAEDSCGAFWSGGTYYRYSDENELWNLFYPE